MNNKERIINTVLCRPVDRLPFFFYFGPWGETYQRWTTEGLQEGTPWEAGIPFDEGIETVNICYGYSPAFESVVLSETEDTMILIDYMGIKQECNKRTSSIPRYIEYPVKNMDDWLKLKEERLRIDDPNRFPPDWEERIAYYNNSPKVIQLGTYPYGLFGTLRDMMGVEELLVSFYEQPELIQDMMDYLTTLWISLYEKVCKDVKVDAIHMWEDMSYSCGPLISPKMVRQFMMPNYQRIKAFADAHNIPIFSLDTDGDVTKLLPIYIESGINLVFPFEVQAGSDINVFREQYPNLCIMGGIDKLEIAKGKDAIDQELDRVKGMFQGTGYIPALDHLIHPGISWENFQYFIQRLVELIGVK